MLNESNDGSYIPALQTRQNNRLPPKRFAKISMAFAGASMTILFIGWVFANTRVPAEDPETHCPLDAELSTHHTLILIDRSDKIEPDQLDVIRRVAFDQFRALPDYGRMTLAVLTGAASDAVTIRFHRCHPPRKSDKPDFAKNMALLDGQIKDAITAIDAEFGNLGQDGEEDHTPILEALRQLPMKEGFTDSTPIRKLILFSDMLQATTSYSFYRYLPNKAKSPPQSFPPAPWDAGIKGVQVEIIEIARPPTPHFRRENILQQGGVLKGWWIETLQNRGAGPVIFHEAASRFP